jgi:UDP-glucose 4-epimerase
MDELKQGKKRIIVTGGAGLIGKPICDLLIENGHIVWSFDNYSNSTNDVHHKDCNVVEIDICQREKVIEKVLEIKPDLIYHLACHPYEGLSQFCPYRVCDTTLMATINMVTAAVKSHSVKRFINFSSMARYGKGHLRDNGTIDGPPYKEWYRPNPEDVYASAKVSAEECVKMLCDLHGIEWCTVIPHNVYGPSNIKTISDPYRGVIMIWTNSLLRGVPFYIYGDGKQVRAPSYIDDVVLPMILMGFKKDAVKKCCNIGADQEYSMNEIAQITIEEFESITGRKATNIIHVEDRPLEVKYSFCSHDLSKKLLDYEEKTTLRQGIRKVVEWAYKIVPNGIENRYLKELEITEKAPETWLKKLI